MRKDSVLPPSAVPKPPEVPLSLEHAGKMIRHVAGKGPDDEIIDAMARAADGISEDTHNIKSATAKILANEMASPLQRLSSARRRATEIYAARAKKLTAARDGIANKIEALEAAVVPAPPKDLGAVVELKALETRQVLRAKKPGERLRAVRAAVERGDAAYVAAVVNEEPEKSGLDPAEYAVARDMWARRWNKDTLDRVARLRKAQSELNRLDALFGKWSNGILAEQSASIAAAERSAELAKAAMADKPSEPMAPAWSE